MVIDIDFWLVVKVPASHRIKQNEEIFLSMASGF